jgi:hypothetical protein
MRIGDGALTDATSQTLTITDPHSRHLRDETLMGNANISALIGIPRHAPTVLLPPVPNWQSTSHRTYSKDNGALVQ